MHRADDRRHDKVAVAAAQERQRLEAPVERDGAPREIPAQVRGRAHDGERPGIAEGDLPHALKRRSQVQAAMAAVSGVEPIDVAFHLAVFNALGKIDRRGGRGVPVRTLAVQRKPRVTAAVGGAHPTAVCAAIDRQGGPIAATPQG